MASTFRNLSRLPSQIFFQRLNGVNNWHQVTGVRWLYSAESLGIDNFLRQRNYLQEKVGNLREEFRLRMEEYMESSTKNTIFTDDLKTIIHVAENEKELETALKMLRRYHVQEDQFHFSNFSFGPLVMRLLHVLKKPKEAMQLMEEEELKDVFRHSSTMNAFVDLLFEEGCYQEILEWTPMLKNRLHVSEARVTSEVTVLYVAACLKLNTRESYDLMRKFVSELKENNQTLSLRGVILAAQLALKQGEDQAASDLLSLILDESFSKSGGSPPLAYITTKGITLARLGNVKEAINFIYGYVNHDRTETRRPAVIFPELVDELTTAVEKSGDEVLKSQLNSLKKQIEDESYLARKTFDEYLFNPIGRRRQMQDGYRQRQRSSVGGYRTQRNRTSYRPSLMGSERDVSY